MTALPRLSLIDFHRTDHCYATVTSSGLRFGTTYFMAVSQPPNVFSVPPPRDILSLETSDRTSQQSVIVEYLSSDIWKLLKGVSRLTEFINAIASPTMSPEDRLTLADKLNLVESRLVESVNILDSMQDIDEEYRFIHETCRLAAIIHVHTTMRACAITNHVVYNLVGRLHSALLHFSELLPAWHMTGELLLWVLFVGGIATKVPMERAWFVEMLADLCTSSRTESWEDVRLVLRKYFWIKTVDDNMEFSLWKEIDVLLSVRKKLD